METMLFDENFVSRIKCPGLISHCWSNLTHKKGLHYAITETSDAQILFEVFQKLLDPILRLEDERPVASIISN